MDAKICLSSTENHYLETLASGRGIIGQTAIIREFYGTDAVTTVYNHKSFTYHMEAWLNCGPNDNGGIHALKFLRVDVHHLRQINEQFGLPMGDNILRAVAQALKDLYPGSPVYRIGGDDFVVKSNQAELPVPGGLGVKQVYQTYKDFLVGNVTPSPKILTAMESSQALLKGLIESFVLLQSIRSVDEYIAQMIQWQFQWHLEKIKTPQWLEFATEVRMDEGLQGEEQYSHWEFLCRHKSTTPGEAL
jgi:GGDEF domain-containing protein